MMMIYPTNPAALEAITIISDKIDKRLAIPEADKVAVASYLLAYRHRPSINVTGYQKIMQALLDSEVIGRAKGKAGYFLKPTYKDLQQLTFQSEDDASLHCYPVSKSGLWAKSRSAAQTLNWDDIGGLGFGAAYFINPVDFAATVAGFRDFYKPSPSFQSCGYAPDEAEAQRFTDTLLVEAWKAGVALAPIGDGFICNNADIALRHFNTHAVRSYNRAGLVFSVITKDSYSRVVHSWGQW
jgi:hypothetical protein